MDQLRGDAVAEGSNGAGGEFGNVGHRIWAFSETGFRSIS
jgi:hypothetical protein